MNQTLAFLRLIWPDTGHYTLVTLNKNKIPNQSFLNEFDEDRIAGYINYANQYHLDAYMAVGSFKDLRRTIANSNGLRAFFLDIDIGVKTPYAGQGDAIRALQMFCNEKRFPKPSALIGSGGGVHAYWATHELIPTALWEVLSKQLIAMLPDSPLFIKDPGISADAARILRLPGTRNYKEAVPRLVEVLHLGPRVGLKQILDVVGMPNRAPAPVAIPVLRPDFISDGGEISLAATLASIGTKPKSFRAILSRSKDGLGCEQITNAVRNRASEAEPVWRALLSIAKFCEDGAEAIHVVSKGHPGYSPQETEAKAQLIIGPYKCSSFDTHRPGVCTRCPHYGRLTSPIQLGETLSTPKTPEVEDVEIKPVVSPITCLLSNEPMAARAITVPYPYLIATDGATYRRITPEEGKTLAKHGATLTTLGEDLVVKEHNGQITLLGRAYDPEQQEEVLHVGYKSGVDTPRFCMLSTRDIGSFDALRKTMSPGAVLNNKDATFVQNFIRASVRADAKERHAEQLLTKYGWYNGCQDYVYGNYVIKHDGTLSNAIMKTIEGFSGDGLLRVSGAPMHWVRMAEYWNREEHLDMAFALLSAFGAPLMSLLNMGVSGSMIHLFTPDSGFGKSALQTMIMSAYGKAQGLMFTPQDTVNALLNRIGFMSNLPVCIDEVTNLPAERLSDLIYQITQGREKLRMKQDYTGNMKPSGDWCTTVVTSGNASITDKLFALKASPEGELMRFLELRPTAKLNGPVTLAHVMDGVTTNFGGIGAMYLYYIVTHRGEVVDLLSQVKTHLQGTKVLGEAQRFWLAQLTCNITGGIIARKLGFVRYDMTAIQEWALSFVTDRAAVIGHRKVRPTNVFNDLVSRLTNSMVVAPEQGMVTPARHIPLARFDYKTATLSISMSALTQEASKFQVAVADVLQGLQSSIYTYRGVEDVVVTQGLPATMYAAITLRCAVYSFDPAKLAVADIPDKPANVIPIRR